MRIIPVLDIRHGQAVRAVAGKRSHYGPLASVLHEGTDPVALATEARSAWGLPDLYLADLDSILGEASPRFELYRRLVDLGLTLWLDAGIKSVRDIPPLIAEGVGRLVVGLETVEGPEALRAIVKEAGASRVVFSLDLREGRPIVATGSGWKTDQVDPIIAIAIELGITQILRLDLARVGTSRGAGVPLEPPDPRASWYAGGGIRDVAEIQTLARSGYAGVLVGSALHDGTIKTPDLENIDS